MIRTILVPLDGSAFAERALPIATELGRRHGASLRLVTVHDPKRAYVTSPELMAAIDEANADALAEAGAYLRRKADEVKVHGVTSTVALWPGDPATVLLEEFQRQVDLVVMTTHGRGGISRAWLGSVADRVVRKGRCPVLLLRPDATPRSVTRLLEDVLVPLDGTVRAESVLDDVHELMSHADGTLHLLNVVIQPFLLDPPPRPSYAEGRAATVEQQRLRGYRYLRRLARPLRLDGKAIATEVVAGSDPVEEILAYVRQHDVRLVAIATRGRGGFARWAIGSVADKVIRSGTAAVLVVHTETVREGNQFSTGYEAALTEPEDSDRLEALEQPVPG